ncbi:MAG TPA: alpha/beta hydrolase [Acidimicrobiales bacterium]|nr:alpha/beta hydrolase [Acidimicrobiales bacterium]
MSTVTLNGHPTWAHVSGGRRPALVLLHGGLSSSRSLRRSIGPRLSRRFAVSAFDRRGHGRTADTDEPFHYEAMAGETIAFLELLGRRAHLVGHSDGGVVALLTARRRPDLVRRVVAVGANFHYSGVASEDNLTFDGPDFEEWAADFGRRSPDGVAHARAVADKSLALFASEPTLTTADLAQIATPTLVLVGDDDAVDLSHTLDLYLNLPDAQLAVVPGASHGVLKERPKACARLIARFLTQQLPPVTTQPRRRARPADPGPDGSAR